MPRTKVVNQTGGSLILKEGTAGVYRMLCSNLETGKTHNIRVDPNATYREYWCAVTPDDDNHVVLSSDDCIEYEEVLIKLKSDNSYTWDGLKRSSRELVPDAGDKAASRQPQAQASGGTGGAANSREPGAVRKVLNTVKSWFSYGAN